MQHGEAGYGSAVWPGHGTTLTLQTNGDNVPGQIAEIAFIFDFNAVLNSASRTQESD
jgi:hypothetical protein